MGRIISLKRENKKIVFEIECAYEEAIALRGHYDNIKLFSEDVFDFQNKISTRGNNKSTKYCLIPTRFRKNLNLSNQVFCQILESKTNNFLIYSLKK